MLEAASAELLGGHMLLAVSEGLGSLFEASAYDHRLPVGALVFGKLRLWL